MTTDGERWDGQDSSGRFDIRGKLGMGGMGVVYEAFDRERNELVALKTLRHLDPRAIVRFKNEFRALSDIHHRNLVTLHELMTADGEWLFTMELIKGCGFMDYVRPPTSMPIPTPTPMPKVLPGRSVDLERLRDGLRQLVDGVAHLHRAGRLHRDIKPPNILVGLPAKRVVLCDFGLVAELADGTYITESRHAAGTAAYMSPEQAARKALTEASDWYSVGAVLYLALAGSTPFADRRKALLRLKQTAEPPPPSQLSDNVPDDLDQLCVALLRRAPEQRATEREIRRVVGGIESTAELGASPASSGELFVGRGVQVTELRAALAASSAGRGTTVFVSGEPGIGKTALVRHFLAEAENEGALVFAGRCYEREALPYKAWDSLIDSVSSHLARLPSDESEQLMPRDCGELARIFPALHRIDAVSEPAVRSFGALDPRESQRRAVVALRKMMVNLASQQPLVLFIDDLQWGDADSSTLLADLMRRPDAPPMLIVSTFRRDGDDATSVFDSVFDGHAKQELRLDCREIVVGPLLVSEAEKLVQSLLGKHSENAAAALAVESRGNPLLVTELVRHAEPHVAARPAPPANELVTVQAMLADRILRLTDEARRLLTVVAVAGRPIRVDVVEGAAKLQGRMTVALAALRGQNLVRTGVGRRRDEIEAFHGRVREAALSLVTEQQIADCHRRVAITLRSLGSDDVEALVQHWLAAGERKRASVAAVTAAEQTANGLAFDRAAALFEIALEYPRSAEEERRLRLGLGAALSNAGRSIEAARAYLLVAQDAPAAHSLELQRLAALELLRGGGVDDGVALLRQVMERVGLEFASTPQRALIRLVAIRARLRMRGIGFTRRHATELSAESLQRIDVCWTTAVGLGMIDTIRGAEFQSRHLLMALQAGEPYRIARALSLEVAFLSSTGARGRRRAEKVKAVAQRLVDKLDVPEQYAWLSGTSALAAHMAGRFVEGRDGAQLTVKLIRDECTGMAWELVSSELYLLWSLYYLGQIKDMSRRVERLQAEAQRRGDLYAASALQTGLPSLHSLFRDEPQQAETLAGEAAEFWSKEGFHLEHYWQLQVRVHRDLYLRQGRAAYDRVVDHWPRLRASHLLRFQAVRIEGHNYRGLAAVAAALDESGPVREKLLRHARKCARKMLREKMPWGIAMALSLQACVQSARGDRDDAIDLFVRAEREFEANSMTLHAIATRYRRGQLTGGVALVDQARERLVEQDIVAPERVVDMYCPLRLDATTR